MAKKQTRRTISVSAPTAARLVRFCEITDQSMSGLVERLVNEWLDTASTGRALVSAEFDVWWSDVGSKLDGQANTKLIARIAWFTSRGER